MSDRGARIAADLRASLADGAYAAPATYYAVQRRSIALVSSGDPAPVTLFLAAGIAATMADRLESGTGVTLPAAVGWRGLAERLAEALETGLGDTGHPAWAELITALHPPQARN